MALSILDKIFLKKQAQRSFFLALEICPDLIKAAVCEAENEKIGILGIGTQVYDGAWENAIIAADTAISSLEENLPQGIILEKVILGLTQDDLLDGKITPSRLAELKVLCEKLSLKPVGFAEISLAIANYLKKQENSGPESLILVRLAKKMDVTIVRVGKITNRISQELTGDVCLDLENALKAFKDVEVLPSKILLFDENSSLEKEKQALLNYPWVSRAAFLHFPKIEVAQENLDIKSIALAGGGEIEPEKRPEEETPIPQPRQPSLVTEEIKEESANLPKMPSLPKISVPNIRFHMPNFKVPSFSLGGKKLKIFVALVALVFLGILGLGFWFLPQAKLTLLLKPKIITQDLTIDLVSPLTFTTEQKGTLSGATSGKKMIGDPAKGTVTIYNKTFSSKTVKKGSIISSNNLKFSLDNEVTIASASASDPTVPPIFGKSDVGVSALAIGPSSNLGASQIFTFIDFSNDVLVAKNSVAFSGGTQREISIASKEDQTKLALQLQNQLTEKAKADLLGKKGEKEQILLETLKAEITGRTFDKNIDDEATNLTLNLSISFSAIGFKNEDLLKGITVPDGYDLGSNDVKYGELDLTKNKDGSYKLQTKAEISFMPKINIQEIKNSLIGKSKNDADTILRKVSNVSGYDLKFVNNFFPLNNFLPHLSSRFSIETSTLK